MSNKNNTKTEDNKDLFVRFSSTYDVVNDQGEVRFYFMHREMTESGWNKYRNIGSMSYEANVNGFYLNGLELRCFFSMRDMTSEDLARIGGGTSMWAWHLEYRDVFSVDAKVAKSMTDTFAKIERAMTKLSLKFGPAPTFPIFAQRLFSVIGVVGLVTFAGNSSTYDEMDACPYTGMAYSAATTELVGGAMIKAYREYKERKNG